MSRFLSVLKIGLIGLLLVTLYIGVQWIVATYKNPNQMGILESMAMDMSIQVPEGAMPVELVKAEKRSFQPSVQYSGTTKAFNTLPIYPRVTGWLKELPVYSGDSIKQGQLLARLDADELSADYAAARFETEQASQGVQAAKADLTYWKAEIERAKALMSEDVITQEEFENEQAQYEKALAHYSQAQAKTNAASSQAQSRSIRLGYTTITAPVSGVITQRPIDPGVLVQPGMKILELVQIDPIRIQAQIAETDFSKLRRGQTVTIWEETQDNGKPVQAKISAIFPDKNSLTRTATVETLVPNADGRFVPGAFITMGIELGKPRSAVMVPTRAIVEQDRQTALWVANDGEAELRYVTTGGSAEGWSEIVSGLEPGTLVIAEGYQGLNTGNKVVAADYGPDGLKSLPNVDSGNRLMASNGYTVKQSLQHTILQANLVKAPPELGVNRIQLKLQPLHGDLPGNLELTVKAFMPSMPKMRVPAASIQHQGAGAFILEFDATMPGLWQIDITLLKGQNPMAETSLEIEVDG